MNNRPGIRNNRSNKDKVNHLLKRLLIPHITLHITKESRICSLELVPVFLEVALPFIRRCKATVGACTAQSYRPAIIITGLKLQRTTQILHLKTTPFRVNKSTIQAIDISRLSQSSNYPEQARKWTSLHLLITS